MGDDLMDAALYGAIKKHIDMRFSQTQPDDHKIYGVYWDKSSDPTLARTHDAIGMIANAGVDGELVQNDFDTASIYREIGDVTDELGNEFVRIPKFYIRKTDGIGFKTWQISKTKYAGFYLPWCFWDFARNRELPYIDVSKYPASLGTDNRLESKPNTYPLIDTHIVNMRNYAQNNNVDGLKGYQQLDIHVVDVLQTLFYVEFATLNSQSIMQGWVNGRYGSGDLTVIAEDNVNRVILPNSSASHYEVGYPIAVGTSQSNANRVYGREITSVEPYDEENVAVYFDGDPVDITEELFVKNAGWKNGFSKDIAASSGSIVSNTNGKYPCMYRGIENPWGNVYQFVDGLNITDHQSWVAENAEDYASNVFASPYEQLGYTNHDANTWVTEMGFDPNHPFAEFPVAGGGSSSTYYADHYYQSTGARIARFGGHWFRGANAGLSLWNLNASSSTADVYIGGRLLKKPL